MYFVEPVVHETIWGGKRLTPFSGTTCEKIGHLYSAIDAPSICNRIFPESEGIGNLHEWFMQKRADYNLEEFDRLPIIIALLDVAADLSIQVHPDDQMAENFELHGRGKNESFYILEPPTSGKIYDGCSAETGEKVRSAINSGEIDAILNMTPCSRGDYLYIEGGTLHAATAGALIFEIEENAGRTFRFYDYDRLDKNGAKRELHLTEALECLDPHKKSHRRKYDSGWIEERLYASRLVPSGSRISVEDGMFVFAVLLEGDMELDGRNVLPGTALLLEPGESLETVECKFMLVKPKRGSR